VDNNKNNDKHATSGEFDRVSFLKETIYKRILEWIRTKVQPRNEEGCAEFVIMLDDASTLSNLFGERLGYFFVFSIRALVKKHGGVLIVRDSSDEEQTNITEDADLTFWVGAVSDGMKKQRSVSTRNGALLEMSEEVIDVMQLASGYAREVHGRFVHSSARPTSVSVSSGLHKGKHGVSSTKTRSVVNFICTDTGVLAIPVKGN